MDDKWQLPFGILLTISIVAMVFILGAASLERSAIADAEEAANPTLPRMCENGQEYKRPYGCNPAPLTNSELLKRIEMLETNTLD